MSREHYEERVNRDELGIDMELAAALEGLVDPADADPNYWLRFRSWILRQAAPELARRRLAVDLTVSDVLNAWSRALVPTAIAACVAAAILLAQSRTAPAEMAISLEEILMEGLDEGESLSALLETSDAEVVAFAAERF